MFDNKGFVSGDPVAALLKGGRLLQGSIRLPENDVGFILNMANGDSYFIPWTSVEFVKLTAPPPD